MTLQGRTAAEGQKGRCCTARPQLSNMLASWKVIQ